MEALFVTLMIVGTIYALFYVRGMVWMLSCVMLINKAIAKFVDSNSLEKRTRKNTILDSVKFLGASLVCSPIVGFFCFLVPREIFIESVAPDMADAYIKELKEENIGTTEERNKIRQYVTQNLTV